MAASRKASSVLLAFFLPSFPRTFFLSSFLARSLLSPQQGRLVSKRFGTGLKKTELLKAQKNERRCISALFFNFSHFFGRVGKGERQAFRFLVSVPLTGHTFFQTKIFLLTLLNTVVVEIGLGSK